jgi:hypothetical protein
MLLALTMLAGVVDATSILALDRNPLLEQVAERDPGPRVALLVDLSWRRERAACAAFLVDAYSRR